MKLAEALAERASAARQVERLRSRIVDSARYQEGEVPAENAEALLRESGETLDRLETLIRQINHTNTVARLDPETTVTDALARRDIMRLRHAVITAGADAASGRNQMGRQLRSELKIFPALPVADLRGQADDLARQIRELDVRIQRSNWEVDLLED